MASESDQLIVEQIKQGDGEAWSALINKYEGRLLAFVQRRLRNRANAEDVVQEAFMGFLTSLPHYDVNRDLQTYLFTIAAYKLTDYLRRTGRHPLQQITDGQEYFEQQHDSQPGVSSIARSQERKGIEEESLITALETILEKWRMEKDFLRVKVLELLFVAGWANKDIAEELDIKDQQVANIRFAAVRKISEHLRNAGLSPEIFPNLGQEELTDA